MIKEVAQQNRTHKNHLSHNQTTFQSFNPTTLQWFNHTISQSNNLPITQSHNPTITQSHNLSISQSNSLLRTELGEEVHLECVRQLRRRAERDVYIRVENFRDVRTRHLHPLRELRLRDAQLLHPQQYTPQERRSYPINRLHLNLGNFCPRCHLMSVPSSTMRISNVPLPSTLKPVLSHYLQFHIEFRRVFQHIMENRSDLFSTTSCRTAWRSMRRRRQNRCGDGVVLVGRKAAGRGSSSHP